MKTRTKGVKASCKARTGVKAAIRELRQFCLDLRKLAIVGCDGRGDEIARNQEMATTPEPWAVEMHSERRTVSRQ